MGDEEVQVRLRPGERKSIRLPGLGTAGYRWTPGRPDAAGIVDVSVTTAPAGEIDGRPPGSSADELATIEGRRPGQATVILEQRRSWETKAAPHDRRVLHITVT
jgi:predicted secreted protein